MAFLLVAVIILSVILGVGCTDQEPPVQPPADTATASGPTGATEPPTTVEPSDTREATTTPQAVETARDRSTSGIFIIDATPGASGGFLAFGFEPAWSPDGSRLAFGSEG